MTTNVLSALANLMLAGAAVAAAIAAFRGLDTWKNQSVWAADNDLARRILVALYRYRNSLYAVRHPAMYNGEMKIDETDAKGLSPDQIRQQGVVMAYVRRWERHQPLEDALDALLLESDAVWGKPLSEKVATLKALQRELLGYIRLHLDANYRGQTALADSYREILRTKRDILYDHMNDDDVFRVDFEASMQPVEAYLRSKLGREK